MKEISDEMYTGKVKLFNGQFGFITFVLGEIFFHKSELRQDFVPQKDDVVEFQRKPSRKKKGMFDACKITLTKKNEKKDKYFVDEEYLLGTVKWFDSIKGYGFISADNTDYFIHVSNFLMTTSISEGDSFLFNKKMHGGRLSAIKCQPFVIGLSNCSSQKQIELLQKYLLKIDSTDSSNYKEIKAISQSDKIEDAAKYIFLKSAFEKVHTYYQYKMLFEDKLIDIQKENSKTQLDFLLKLGKLDIVKIKFIAQSENIEDIAKEIFLKSVFEKIETEYQCDMLLDGLIVLSVENQIEFLQKYLLKFNSITYSNYNRFKSIAQSENIEKAAKEIFLKSVFEKVETEYQCDMLLDGLIVLSVENQIEFLQKYLLKLNSITYSNYNRVKSIAQSDKIEETAKGIFLKKAFENANTDYQFKILFEDNLIDIQKETAENQIELLQRFGKLDIDKINFIFHTDKIEETTKDIFLKTVFEKADTEYQCDMLLDGLIVFSVENQIEFLEKYLLKFNSITYSTYDRVKSIAQSDKIEETAKGLFLKKAFEKADADCQYKILFEDNLIKDMSHIDYLLVTTKSGRKKFAKGNYAGKTYFEVLEENIAYLQRYALNENIDIFYNKYSPSETYKRLKIVWISILNGINTGLYNISITELRKYDAIIELYHIFKIPFDENVFKNAIKNVINKTGFNFLDYLEDYELLYVVKQYNQELYNKLFQENYFQISKKDRLYLWLKGLNPHYNYLEFVQVAWYLSNDERKLFNKQIKEHAKNERLQKFIDQIPTAKLVEETEKIKIYNCKWRNLYYKEGAIQVFLDKTTATDSYYWESSREEWNLLTQEYFNNRRIDDIIVSIDNNNRITEISGLEDIEVKIIIAEVRKKGSTERRTDIASSQVTKIIHNVAARNQCINFLASQKTDYNALDIQELVTDDYGSLHRDVSFLFSIPDEADDIYLIWESAEFEKSKATHIFKCKENVLENIERKIKNFIENNIRTRSRLNSVENEDLKVKQELQYFCRVNHDTVEYQVWENRMRDILPFLK